MSNLVKFPGTKNNQFDNINLYDWSGRDGEYGTRNEEDLRTVFLNMDIALKYIHDHGYCVKSFSPLDIELLSGSMEQIKFNYLLEMPIDALDRKKLIQEDIFNSSCVQIGIYTNTLKNLRKEFLKSNFDDFAKHIPQSDVAYYRGVIQRNAAVYLSEYALEKRNRDLESLEKELGEEYKTVTFADFENGELSDCIKNSNSSEAFVTNNSSFTNGSDYAMKIVDKRSKTATSARTFATLSFTNDMLKDSAGFRFFIKADGDVYKPIIRKDKASEKEMLCPYGISAVDMTAGYFMVNGYWNGNVWFPHQWFIWKTLLDLGDGEFAHKVAKLALDIWKREVDYSYYTFEMVSVVTGRGGWFHNFGGLSAPLNIWLNAYYKPGTLTTGLDTWVDRYEFSADNKSLEAHITCFGGGGTVLAVLDESVACNCKAYLDGEEVPVVEREKGCLEISISVKDNKVHTLRVQ